MGQASVQKVVLAVDPNQLQMKEIYFWLEFEVSRGFNIHIQHYESRYGFNQKYLAI
jgi:hypothetical protein